MLRLHPKHEEAVQQLAELVRKGERRPKMDLTLRINVKLIVEPDKLTDPYDEPEGVYTEDEKLAFFSGQWGYVTIKAVVVSGKVRSVSPGISGVELGRFTNPDAQDHYLSLLITDEIVNASERIFAMTSALRVQDPEAIETNWQGRREAA